MPATVTLSTTTLTSGMNPRETKVYLASLSGIYPGYRLFVDKEQMEVLSTERTNIANVKRGSDGTASSAHLSGATATIGQAHQFYFQDPIGIPDSAIQVSPYINLRNGKVFYAQGDTDSASLRWWQEVTTTYGSGALGIRTVESSPASST